MMIVDRKLLRENPDKIFVYGDNTIRQGKRGAALLRDEPNTYGFITKRFPNNIPNSFFKPKDYRPVFGWEMIKLTKEIKSNPDKQYLISKLGSGLANKYLIWEKVIRRGLEELRKYPNVTFLYDKEL